MTIVLIAPNGLNAKNAFPFGTVLKFWRYFPFAAVSPARIAK